MPKGTDNLDPSLMNWFDRLIKNKMSGIAVPVSGIAISCFLLTFAKLFSEFIFYSVSVIALIILSTSAALFIYASVRLVVGSFGAAGVEPLRGRPGPGGSAVPAENNSR